MSQEIELSHNLTPTCKALLAGLPHPAWTCLPHGPCNHLSERWVEYTGVPEQQHLEFGWLDALHPDDRDRVVAEWTAQAQLEKRFDTQFRIRRHDGVYRSFQTSACPIKNDAGELLFWLGTNTDVQGLLDVKDELREANRKLEERVEQRTRALKESYERLSLASDIADLGVWEWEPESDTVEWDERMCQLLEDDGGGSGNRTLQVWLDRLHNSDRTSFRSALSGLMESELHLRTVVRLDFNEKGADKLLEIVAGVYREGDGGRIRVIGVARDITEERLSSLRLGYTQRLLKQFVKNVPAAIAMLDSELRHIDVSDRWGLDYGFGSKDEVIGRNHYELFPDLPERWRAVHRRVLQGQTEKMEEDHFPRDDGTTLWLRWECQPWYTVDNEIGGIILFTQDITRQKEMELQITQQSKELIRSNSDLEQFARAASHDLQTPLRSVANCVELLQSYLEQDRREDVDEVLTHIVTGVKRMSELVRGILGFSMLERTLVFEVVCLEAVLGEILFDLRESPSGAERRLLLPELPQVWGAYSLLVQLFQNLVGNAFKYGGAEVKLTVSEEEQHWEFGVHDNGSGIAPEYQDCVFDLFRRLHSYSQYDG